MSESTAALLERAAEVVVQRGFCQDEFMDGEGRVCLTASVGMAAGLTPEEIGRGASSSPKLREALATDEVQAATRAMGFMGVWEMCAWNNETVRTADQVIGRLREGARTAREQEPATA